MNVSVWDCPCVHKLVLMPDQTDWRLCLLWALGVPAMLCFHNFVVRCELAHVHIPARSFHKSDPIELISKLWMIRWPHFCREFLPTEGKIFSCATLDCNTPSTLNDSTDKTSSHKWMFFARNWKIMKSVLQIKVKVFFTRDSVVGKTFQ